MSLNTGTPHVATIGARTYPKGPDRITARHPFRFVERKRAIARSGRSVSHPAVASISVMRKLEVSTPPPSDLTRLCHTAALVDKPDLSFSPWARPAIKAHSPDAVARFRQPTRIT